MQHIPRCESETRDHLQRDPDAVEDKANNKARETLKEFRP